MTSHAHPHGNAGDSLPPLISALREGACFDHPTDIITVLQTHISYVLLTGTFAYKIKKSISLPFLDFSTLEFRKHYCEEELRINRRLAPELYVDVVPITGALEAPRVNAEGRAIEYAVKMIQFPDKDRLDRVADRGELVAMQVREVAKKIAEFHETVAVADRKTPFASSGSLRREVMDNFESLTGQVIPESAASLIEDIRSWSARSLVDLGAAFRARKQAGKVRECHGDMHLANMALLNGQVTIFDALEFNENLRWVDVQSELAFLAMDLDYRRLPGLGWLLVSTYLGMTGDYAGLRVFRHYKVYRAMVRTKVAALRWRQCADGTPEREQAVAELVSHIRLAHAYLKPSERTPLIITQGLSGSGKSRLCERLMPVLGAVCVRSDVERHRLARTGAIAAEDLYSADAINGTYEALAGHARTIIDSGYPVIVDATFLEQHHRRRFLEIARELGVPFVILCLRAPAKILEARIAKRRAETDNVSDATAEVLHRQRENMEELDAEEREAATVIDSETETDVTVLAQRILRSHPAPWSRRLDYPSHPGH
jgi:aminoglycoside phosphotransferase family enzyme/predicted kinase